MAGPSAAAETFNCQYCGRPFNSKRARGGHLKVHRRRASQQAGGLVQTPTAAMPPLQQGSNANQSRALILYQPVPQMGRLALPEANGTSTLVTVPVHQQLAVAPRLRNADLECTPEVFFRCCCGVTEKIPQTKQELLERGTYEGGCFTLNHRHQHDPSEEIQPLDLFPPAEVAAEENSVDGGEGSGENIDLSLRL